MDLRRRIDARRHMWHQHHQRLRPVQMVVGGNTQLRHPAAPSRYQWMKVISYPACLLLCMTSSAKTSHGRKLMSPTPMAKRVNISSFVVGGLRVAMRLVAETRKRRDFFSVTRASLTSQELILPQLKHTILGAGRRIVIMLGEVIHWV